MTSNDKSVLLLITVIKYDSNKPGTAGWVFPLGFGLPLQFQMCKQLREEPAVMQ